MKILIPIFFMIVLVKSPAFAQDAEPNQSASTIAFDKAHFNELIKESKIAEAAEVLDRELALTPDADELQSLDYVLANRQMRNDAVAATNRLEALVNRLCNRTELPVRMANELSMATSTYSLLLARDDRMSEAKTVVEKAIQSLQRAGDAALSPQRTLEIQLARLVYQSGDKDIAKSQMLSTFDAIVKSVSNDIEPARNLAMAASTFASVFRSEAPEDVKNLMQRADTFLDKRYQVTNSIRDVDAYVTFKSSDISSRVYSDPEQGLEMAKQLIFKLDSIETTNEKELNALKQRINAMMPNLEKSLARLKLIDKEAPDYDAESFVGMEPVQLSGLRGRVVLLDFWAVWCGPCIATFPHLIDWHERFSDKGLTILGITSDQGYLWDEKNRRAVRGEDVTHEQELEMLELFREHHQLKHGFVILPKGSSYNRQLMVSGIPQAVLLDKQGRIRLIKVGSGESNAESLESAIEKLLAE